ncbi:hypothetical protein LTR56_017541 [Elasticomyces elasticus]|nr:hypothetical protein LTR22_022401 [Elasticomyces elasticus]KAK3630253.1 hypothetical protein LTR56_017541 [Elasticomyces elasticus]KAK4913909.1 hypothetical protein LTR49_017835 [Elasticomyces elasticus]KAK5766370.1 hypothetical protein LTS12_003582 [Elasticomyces elasticus]
MKTSTTVLTATLASLAAAAPTKTINKRATTSDCAQYGSTTASPYVISNDLWGEANGAGSQCYTSNGVSDGSLSWGTTWSWANNANDVKSYANVILDFTPTQLSGISSLMSSWDWSYTGDSIVADVSYDLFTNSVASTTSEEYEIMIWLGRLGTAGPIASSYDASGNPVAVASTTVAGHTFDLYKGTNGVQTATYSFLATENITSFSGDVNEFLTYLVGSQGFDSSQYLVSIGAGTEAFTGSNAVFTTSSYSIAIEMGSDSSSDSSAASSIVDTQVAVASSAPSAVASPSTATTTATSSAAVSSSASSVATVSTAALTSSTVVSAISSSVSYAAATSVAAVSTSASVTSTSSAPVYTEAPTSSHHHHPYSSGTPGEGCNIKYVYV